MLRKSCFTLALLALLGLGATAHADPLSAPVTLSTVDQFERQGSDLTFVGIVSGQSTASTIEINTPPDNYSTYASSSASTCEHAALLMMNRPGRFQLLITAGDQNSNSHCRLIRLTQ